MKKWFLLTLLPLTAIAAPIKGFEANYDDWDLVCDNTGTCRMAGYQVREYENPPVAIFFTREAGEKGQITAEFGLYSNYSNEEVKTSNTAEIFLNGQSLGAFPLNQEERGKLNATQAKILLEALRKKAQIEIVSGEFRGKVSDKGATATMLRMDEFQQRLDTPSALVRKGNSTKAVLSAQPIPKIGAVKIPHRQSEELSEGEKYQKLHALLRKADNGSCDEIADNENLIRIYPLTNRKVLVETLCVQGAYQATNYYAVLDDKLTKVEQTLAEEYNEADYDENHFMVVSGNYKGRGTADCLYGRDAVWNGKIFIRTSKWTTGACRGFIGGGWKLPMFVSEVVAK